MNLSPLTHDDALFENAEHVAEYDESCHANIHWQICHNDTHECDIAIVNVHLPLGRVQ